MIFLNPILAAVGLACIAAPILIHILMRRRRRPVAWGAMKFLLEAYRRQRRRMNLEQILLLAARCLLVALVALAVGKPLIAGGAGVAAGTARTVHLVIDQSIASGAEVDGAVAVERLREAALELLDELDPSRGDRIAIYSAAGPASALISPPTADFASARSVLRDLRALDSAADIPGAVRLASEAMDESRDEAGQPIIAVFSEFRGGSVDAERAIEMARADGGVRVAATRPAAAVIGNVGVVSVEPLRAVVLGGAEGSAVEPIPVRVTVRRSGPGVREAGEATVTVTAEAGNAAGGPTGAGGVAGGGAGAAETPITARAVFAPGQEVASALALVQPRALPQAGGSLIVTGAVGGDALSNDNVSRAPVEFRRRLEVAVIAAETTARPGSAIDAYSAADWFSLALTPRADALSFRRTATDIRISRLDPRRDIEGAGALAPYDAAIVTRPDLLNAGGWEQLADAAARGALVMVVPPAEVETHLWTDAMLAAFEVSWTIARDAEEIAGGGAEISADRSAFSDDPLALIGPELVELVRPARVSRILPVQMSGLEGSGGEGEAWLRLADGRPLVIATGGGNSSAAVSDRGALVLLTTSPALSWSDIATKPLMVPLTQELIRQGVGRAVGTRKATAGEIPVMPDGAVELVSLSGAGEILRVVRGGTAAAGQPESAIQRSGLWAARSGDGRTLATIAVNPDAAGGVVNTLDTAEVASWLSGAGAEVEWIDADAGGSPSAAEGPAFDLRRSDDAPTLSLPLLIAALVVGLIEVVLAKVFSHARLEDAAAGGAGGSGAAGGAGQEAAA